MKPRFGLIRKHYDDKNFSTIIDVLIGIFFYFFPFVFQKFESNPFFFSRNSFFELNFRNIAE